MTVLVTGGAGYIGSHIAYALIDRGERVLVLDNLSSGIRALVSKDALFVHGDVGDQALVRRIMYEHNVDAVIHLAGSVVVPESVTQPLSYYRNNTVASLALVEVCIAENVRHFIFSSSAAVYGVPNSEAVTEDSPTNPINPYGRSKLMFEWILRDASRAHEDFKHIVLRYFNVAGADPLGRTGQSTPSATHLIKKACEVVLGRTTHLDVYGTDYPTLDGTGVRDYIHVSDLVSAHLVALDALRSGGNSNCFNCGYGRGFSVRDVISEFERITGKTLPIIEGPRRAGDAASIVADPSKLKLTLNWQPEYESLHAIVLSALQWEQHSRN
jgi:UDP-glucose 4-epimerase